MATLDWPWLPRHPFHKPLCEQRPLSAWRWPQEVGFWWCSRPPNSLVTQLPTPPMKARACLLR